MAKRVIVYTTAACPWCGALKEFLRQKGVAFTEKDAGKPEIAQELFKRTGQMSVPVVLVDGQVIIGFDKAALVKALGI